MAVLMKIKTLEDLQDALSLALQGDLENGVRWLNEEASAKFVKDYPSLNEVLGKIMDLESLLPSGE